jgi:osmotically inducible protein OsmC
VAREATAVWNGTLKEGNGTITVPSGALKGARYSFATRFEGQPGMNPEELIAAAHAGCFSMALSGKLTTAGHKPDTIETVCHISMDETDAGMTVTKSHLTTKAKVPGISADEFQKLAEDAKATCPISRLLKADITLDATLEGA